MKGMRVFMYVLSFNEINNAAVSIVGGKGANLVELSKIEGILVPDGFCVTTYVYKKIMEQNMECNELINKLADVKVYENEKINEISSKIRMSIEKTVIPKDIEKEITDYILKLGEKDAYAIRSSATFEDMKGVSFAGQQDTYLNIIGKDEILSHIKKCLASLYTERAVTYRIQHGFDHKKAYISVIVQKMIFSEVSGIMFTADPITSNRKVLSIDASFGLGEALVSGLVSADIYKVKQGKIVNKKISSKKLAIYPTETGGTRQESIKANTKALQALTDDEILTLEKIGRKIEEHFSYPQDIEWCLYDHNFYIVQSRPITTLYPLPKAKEGNRIYYSFAHRQMMTDAMKPLGLSFFKIIFHKTTNTWLDDAGGRLYGDISHEMHSFIMRSFFLRTMDTVDILMQKSLINLTKQKDYIKNLYHGKTSSIENKVWLTWGLQTMRNYNKNDPSIVNKLMKKNMNAVRDIEKKMESASGDEVFDLILANIDLIQKGVYEGYQVVFAAAYATYWLNKNIERWLNEKNIADVLSQSVSNNVTSEMGLDLLDVADVIRKYPAVIEYLELADDENFFNELFKVEGGPLACDTIKYYFKKYGMRCSAEIDITRDRWSEKPTLLVPMILNNVRAFGPDEHSNKIKQGLLEYENKEKDILSRLMKLPSGAKKVKKTKKAISILRNFAGYREFNKYLLTWYFFIAKKAILKESANLVQNKVINTIDDIYYLTYDELRNAIKKNKVDYELINKRKEEHSYFQKLTPPRVMTSDGEIISSEYDRGNFPKGSLIGTAVSSGIIEGRARVILKLENADIKEGDILITSFTDPSWTPLFITIKGLVTEVGGMMTHGAVVAREYGLPAVVGVDNATKLIKDGDTIRVNGSKGYVEILDKFN